MSDSEQDFVQTIKLLLEGKDKEARLLMNTFAKPLQKKRPDLSNDIKKIISSMSRHSIERPSMPDPLPVDHDSRLELLKKETIEDFEITPVWQKKIAKELNSVIAERERHIDLLREGLLPTRSLLLVGPPGTGKTLSAKWLSNKMNLPLLTLDLAAVMSSYLGKTGSNIRVVLDYAKRTPSILLLDEFDAIAKRRDDVAEVGELKRLVTVLLQSIDEWPSDRILLAATNHPELLDPAIWRRFDRILEFSSPTYEERFELVVKLFEKSSMELGAEIFSILAVILIDKSFAEIEKKINMLRKVSLLTDTKIHDIVNEYISSEIHTLKKAEKISMAKLFDGAGFTQRHIHEITGISRDTLREHGIGTKKIMEGHRVYE